MQKINDPRDIDAENFYRLVLIVRNIAVARPNNLAKFADQHAAKLIDISSGKVELLKIGYFIDFFYSLFFF